MKKLILIFAALFFFDLGVYAQRSGRSSERSSSRKESSAVKPSSSRGSSSATRSSSRSSSSNSRSKAVSPSRSSSGSSSSRSVKQSSTPSRSSSTYKNSRSSSSKSPRSSSSRTNGSNAGARSSSTSKSSGYTNSQRSSSNARSYQSSGRSNNSRNSTVNRSGSRSSQERGNGISNNNGDRRYRDNGNKFGDNGVRTRTHWQDRNQSYQRRPGNSRNERANPKRTEVTTSRSSNRRIERNTPQGVVVETRGTTYRKNVNIVRDTRVVNYHVVRPRPIEYRRVHYVYRAPRRVNFFWSVNVYNDFCNFYPHVTQWHYRTGARINTISAYDAMFFIGEVKRVYGEVQEVFYSREDDTYYLYIGARFPYHDFSIVIPGRDYRRNNFPPIDRLNFQHVWAMGLITAYNERPEIVIKRPYQLGIY